MVYEVFARTLDPIAGVIVHVSATLSQLITAIRYMDRMSKMKEWEVAVAGFQRDLCVPDERELVTVCPLMRIC